MKIKLNIILLIIFIGIHSINAEENIRKVATWNMKWLGTNSGNQLDAVENVPEYAMTKKHEAYFSLCPSIKAVELPVCRQAGT